MMKRKQISINLLWLLIGVIIFALIIMIPITMISTITAGAESEVVINEQASLESFFNRYIIPIVTGTVGTVLIGVLAILRPYIRRVGENKTLRAVYGTTKDKLAIAEDEIKELKGKLEGLDIEDILKNLTEKAVSVAQEKTQEIIKAELEKRTDLNEKILSDVEVVSAQLQNLIHSAMLSWKEVDGVDKILAKSPVASALEKQAKEVQYLKTFIADRLEMEAKDIQALLDKATEGK